MMLLYRSGDPWPEASYNGFAGGLSIKRPAAAPRPVRASSRSPRMLLPVALAAVVGLAIGGALWAYSELEGRGPDDGELRAPPAALPPLAAEPTQVAPTADAVDLPVAPLDASAIASVDPTQPAPSPEVRPAIVADPAPPAEAVQPQARAKPRPVRVARRAGLSEEALRDASAATARANFNAAYAPDSTLAAQAAALSQQPPAEPSEGD